MSAIDRLDAVSLSEVDEAAALRTRRDRKYLFGPAELEDLLDALPSGTRVLEVGGRRRFGYRTVYFDDHRRELFLAAAHARPRRTKVRTRTYVDSGATLVEVKVRDSRGRTVKHRFEGSADHERALDQAAHDSVAGVDERLAELDLRPALVTRFTRSTLLLPGGGRATIDLDLDLAMAGSGDWMPPGVAVVETKSSGGPTALDRLLWGGHRRPIRFSKYGTGMAWLDPSLPANRWHRALTRLGRHQRLAQVDARGRIGHDSGPRWAASSAG